MKGYNTDIYGFIEAIPQDIGDSLKHKKAAVFGSGGAARAVCAGLGMLGVNEINIYARNVEKSLKLKDAITENFPDIKVLTKEYNEFADLSYASILVNTTPVGMEGANEDISPVNKNSIQSLPDNALVYDLIYKPRKTKMLQYARKRDLYTLDGLEMLVLQGAKGLTIWTGQEAPVEIMREALLKSLQSG
ncbi:MAG: hypothetical protein MZV70_76705 [Desulfobacterales bacterium]|nr:hypothetical protein [Desulfobacterales bacterium]